MADDTLPDLPKYDFGTPEWRKQFAFELHKTTDGTKHVVNISGHPLDYYMSKKWIKRSQYEGGMKLWADFDLAGFINYGRDAEIRERVDCLAKLEVSDHRLDRKRRWHKAMIFMGDTISRKLVYMVCCEERWLKELSIPYYHTSTNAMPRLRESLDKLADFYGIPRSNEEEPGEKAGSAPKTSAPSA